jgi:DNA-binding LytR/AlgR family response regulator
MLMLLLGLARGVSMTNFRVEPVFNGPAFGWQFLQGLTFYALIVAVVLLKARPTEPNTLLAIPSEAAAAVPAEFNRYLIRIGDDIHPIDVSDIVMITGADDYTEVTTRTSRHLAKMTMADFENCLSDGRFVRVHRSRIINLDCISRAEPAGNGRLLIHLITGDVVASSRSGSKLLRERVI